MSSLESLVYSLIDRYMAGGTGLIGNAKYRERHGIVTSYDPERYLAKVMIMPEGQESGWLPVETGHIGDNYGIAIGLQPGDGKSTGDQVIMRYQEDDLESGKIVQRVHSDSDKPPTVQSGELVIWTKFKKTTGNSGLGDDQTEGGSGGDSDQAQSGQAGSGCQFYFKNDGSAVFTDGNGATIKLDGKGNISIACKKLQVDAKDVITVLGQKDVGIKGSGNVVLKAGGKLGIEAGEAVWQDGQGDVADGKVTPPGSAVSVTSFQTP